MDSQWTAQPWAANYSLSLHYTQSPQSAIVQISLSTRYDYTDWAVPVSHAIAAFTGMVTTDGGFSDLLEGGITSTVSANKLTEIYGLLIADNCYAEGIVNGFIWPSV